MEVWDIGVHGLHEYAAAGVYSHNCYVESMAPPYGWLTQAEVDEKRDIIPDHMWRTEYELQEPNPEDRAIVPEKVEAAFDETKLVHAPFDQEVVLERPVVGASYATGTDWAKEQHESVITTFRIDRRPHKIVAYRRTGRKPWPVMVGYHNERVREYKGPSAHDATGIGNVVQDYLTVDTQPIVLSGFTRSDIFSKWISCIERGGFKSDRIDHCFGQHLYASQADIYGSGHPPDSFVSCALAEYASTLGQSYWVRNY